MAEAKAAGRQAKEEERWRRFMDTEEKKMNRQIARDVVEYERRKAKEAHEVAMNRPGRSPSRPRIEPHDLAAAAEAALGKPKAKAKAKASVAEVTAMAEERFGKGRAKAKAAVKKQLKDTIRRVPINAKPKGRPTGSRNKKMLEESAVAAIAAA
jgi:hypothetical protein